MIAGMFIITTGKINGDRSESVLTVSAELVIGEDNLTNFMDDM